MTKLTDILQQPEGRRLELKEQLPTNAELAKTIIAFANDARGELFVGIKDNPCKVVGVYEEELFAFEERLPA